MMCGGVSNGHTVDEGVGEMGMRDISELQVGAYQSPFCPVSSPCTDLTVCSGTDSGFPKSGLCMVTGLQVGFFFL